MEKQIRRHTLLIVAVAFSSFFALGMTNGAFAIAWGGIETDLGLMLSHSGIIIMANQIAYALSSSMVGKLYKYTWLENIDFLGILILSVGLLGIGLSSNFFVLLMFIFIMGIGSGLIDASISTYMTQFFSSRHLNWMYVFWGVGSTLSPLLMAHMVMNTSWRYGYISLAAILGGISIIVFVSLMLGVWNTTKDIEREKMRLEKAKNKGALKRRYLTKTWHQVAEVFTCFLNGGLDYAFVFFTAQIMSMRLGPEAATSFTSVYYFSMMLGSLFFGWIAKWKSNMFIIRCGLTLAIIGILIVMSTNSIIGMAFAGFGLGPIFPSLVHDTSNRFTPRVLSKLVGYEVAAFGAGTAIVFYLLSVLLPIIGMDKLFFISLSFAVCIFVINELLEKERKRSKEMTAAE